MPTWKATSCANSNIAFIKYWGNRDEALRLPVNGSLSMNLDGLTTRTTVEFSPDFAADNAIVDDKQMIGLGLERISRQLDYVRKMAGVNYHATVQSENNFPSGAGIASSASAFAALSPAATAALDLKVSERDFMKLACLGSGSASLSVSAAFVAS